MDNKIKIKCIYKMDNFNFYIINDCREPLIIIIFLSCVKNMNYQR